MRSLVVVRVVLTAATMLSWTIGPAWSVEYRTPVTKQLFTCASPGLSRVAATAAEAGPAPCCDGQLKCAQFLSTTGLEKLRLDPRT